jgi:hypothetical protein
MDVLTMFPVWIFIELIFVCFAYVETRGPTLEEVAKIFDGNDAEVAHVDIGKVESHLMTSGFEKDAGVRVHDIQLQDFRPPERYERL